MMHLTRNCEISGNKETRSQSAQGLTTTLSSPIVKIPMPPKLWITDISNDSSDESDGDEGAYCVERMRVRSRYRLNKYRAASSVPIGIFWDIENCQVGCCINAIDIVAAIRTKFLPGRREADFVVVCDVRKESTWRLQELNDAQVSLIHVCGTQKNAADEKLRQCMRRFGELHSAPAALLLISGDINFAADLSDFRHRKNMEVILVHKQNTSSALIACATSNYCYNELTVDLPRKVKAVSSVEALIDNCGGKVMKVTPPTAILRFPTPDHASRALKRMDGEDVFGRKISTRNVLTPQFAPTYSSDEGYSTAPAPPASLLRRPIVHTPVLQTSVTGPVQSDAVVTSDAVCGEWAIALQQLPALNPSPYCPPHARIIRGTHGSHNLDQSGCSSGNSGDDTRSVRENGHIRAVSPWNSSASFSEQSSEGEAEQGADLTVTNLPPYDVKTLQDMLVQLFSKYVPVVRVSVWMSSEGPTATISLRSEWDARLAIARIHKRRLENQWMSRRLELSLGRPSPAPSTDVLKARLRAILFDQKNHTLPLLRLRDAYASRHCCALTTSDISKVKDTVVIHEGFGRMVQLIDLTPVSSAEMEEAPWKCNLHATMNTGHEDGSRILTPVYMELAVLAKHTEILLQDHKGILPLLSFVECYEATFAPLVVDSTHGVALELLLRSIPTLVVRDTPSRHITWRPERADTPSPQGHDGETGSISGSVVSVGRERPRTAPALEPMLALFERELTDLLRTSSRCSIPFSKLIPAFHHHFGRQCRVADYGFTKLPELLSALSNTIVVLGSGSSRLITISAVAQSRRWTSDLVKVLKAQSGRVVYPHEIAQLYQTTIGRAFLPADYGVCTLAELMARVAPHAVLVCADGGVVLPRRTPTPEERARTAQFALQAIELLCHTPNLRMEFARFVPAYHGHFGRQLRVAHYGCVKLLELFELVPDMLTVKIGVGGERMVRLALRMARGTLARRLCAIGPLPLEALPGAYSAQFGGVPLPDMLDATSLEELVLVAGGCVENGAALPPGLAPHWVSLELAACAVLCSDRSVTARGSTEEYFVTAFLERFGSQPELAGLVRARVLSAAEGRVQVSGVWRAVWRVAQLLTARQGPMTSAELAAAYAQRYESSFPPTELGFERMVDFLQCFVEVFKEENGCYSLSEGVSVPRCPEFPLPQEDFSVHDTPPGQKGSRVFESPLFKNIWNSPPASALPAPSALLGQDPKRDVGSAKGRGPHSGFQRILRTRQLNKVS
ncbi:Meiosis regulator and mRNA stability factor 1 [Eumeta japonica]|uniref:Meiosis regulator and mRNA stability factor 1 n=1 Tax=Eumeta variegata TaxID=151549 RepID=A0A4C1V5U8_EUMVA|nr:Meiosis regulator and mRNA stability factor 1 [Eumeta japonica]